MPRPIIEARGVGKEYRLGAYDSTKSFREAIARSTSSAVRRLRPARTPARARQPHNETFWALTAVDLDVQQGEVLGILGRNGAGKSTLLKVLSRITEPTTGRIELRGRVASLLEVGTGFHSELTGRENVYLNGTILGMRRHEIARKFDEIVAFAGVERFIDTPVKRYSSGMYVRLAFAVAAHLEPEILIVDEVLAVGDAEFQRKCLGKMSDVAQQGRTVLFVSHSMPAIQGLCSRAVVLDAGCVVADGRVDSAINRYLELGRTRPADGRRLKRSPGTDPSHIETTAVELLVAGRPATSVLAGEACTFRVHYRTLHHAAIGERYAPQLRILADGQRLLTLGPALLSGDGIPAEAEGAVDCHIAHWPIREKRITVELASWAGVAFQEHVAEALAFDSHDGDFHRSGIAPHPNDGFVFLEHHWEPALDR